MACVLCSKHVYLYDNYVSLTCQHILHADCFDADYDTTCPCCRTPIIDIVDSRVLNNDIINTSYLESENNNDSNSDIDTINDAWDKLDGYSYQDWHGDAESNDDDNYDNDF
jgi:hypothetical protein